MDNTSLPSDVWNDVTTSSSLTLYLANIRYVALKIIYIIIGTVGVLNNVCRRPWQRLSASLTTSVGVLDNLFVIIVFALFIKITDKVFR